MASGSPTSRTRIHSCPAIACSYRSEIFVELRSASCPSSHKILRASSAVFACQYLVATTATPPGTTTTSKTPGNPSMDDLSKDRSFPPKHGQFLTAAYTISGNSKSIPKIADPSTLEGMSTFGCDFPRICHSDLGLRIRFCGGTFLLAASASCPNVKCRDDCL